MRDGPHDNLVIGRGRRSVILIHGAVGQHPIRGSETRLPTVSLLAAVQERGTQGTLSWPSGADCTRSITVTLSINASIIIGMSAAARGQVIQSTLLLRYVTEWH